MKKLLLGLVVLVVVAAGGLAYVANRADSLVRAAVVRYAPDILGAPVSLGDVRISLRRGRAGLSDLVIGNPPGFASDHAMRLARVDVGLEVGSLFSDEIIIDEIAINGPELTFELGAGGSNFAAISKNAEAATADMTGGNEETTDQDTPRLVIRKLDITDGQVQVIANIGGARGTSVSLPDIHLRNLGRAGAGLTPQEAAKKIVGTLAAAATRAVSSSGISGLVGQSVNAGDVTRSVKTRAKTKAKKALKKLKGLFKRN